MLHTDEYSFPDFETRTSLAERRLNSLFNSKIEPDPKIRLGMILINR